VFAQLTYRESLRDIEASLSAQSAKLYPVDIGSLIKRSTLADANERRDWRIYAEFAQRLISQARKLYAEEDHGLGLANSVYVLDSNTIDLCPSLFPWAQGITYDQPVALSGFYSQRSYPHHLRHIRFKEPETVKANIFVSNQFTLPTTTICELCKARWQVELFFKWIKQHLRIKKFYGTSDNAVKVTFWTAGSVCVLVAIIKKRLNLDASLYTFLQVCLVTLLEIIYIN
jgi:DDE family transposase/uncharacterized protein DUF4372